MKKNNYNIKINPSQPSSEDIARHKDFDALLRQLQETSASAPKPAPRVRWLRYAVAAAAVVLLGVFGIVLLQEDASITNEQYFAAQPFINPPLENIQPQFVSKSVNANQGGIYEYENGSKLVVPAAAFQDANGQVVKGDVDIVYREMHDFVDFFLSGIPMTYDSAGVQYILESAGMVEIYAEQNGQRIDMQPGKEIQVELVSYVNMPRLNVKPKYNIYKLDVANRNWKYMNIDNIEIMEDIESADLPDNQALAAIEQELKSKLAAIETQETNELQTLETTQSLPSEPIQPQKANPNDLTIDLDIPANASEELKTLKSKYGNIVWSISKDTPGFNENALRVEWEDVKINPTADGKYELVFSKGINQFKAMAKPSLSETDYQAALQTYENDLRAYRQQLALRDMELREPREKVIEKYQNEKEAATEAYTAKVEEWIKNNQNDPAVNQMVRRKITNRFAATSFGIWNCDRPIHPKDLKVKGKFTNNLEHEFGEQTAYLVDRNRNTIVKIYAKDGADVEFNKNSENLMWMVTSNNQIAVFRPEDFKKINQSKNNHTFLMRVEEKALKTEEDVRSILRFNEM